MKEIAVPDCIVDHLKGKDLPPGSPLYFLYGAGRALSFARMSAIELQELGSQQKIAEYHSYCGISACRTATDATSNWLNYVLEIQQNQGAGLDVAKEPFRKKVIEAQPSIKCAVERLGALARQVDPYRQAWQHREGVAMVYHGTGLAEMIAEISNESSASGRWHIALRGLEQNRSEDKYAPQLLCDWANQTEEAICECIDILGEGLP